MGEKGKKIKAALHFFIFVPLALLSWGSRISLFRSILKGHFSFNASENSIINHLSFSLVLPSFLPSFFSNGGQMFSHSILDRVNHQWDSGGWSCDVLTNSSVSKCKAENEVTSAGSLSSSSPAIFILSFFFLPSVTQCDGWLVVFILLCVFSSATASAVATTLRSSLCLLDSFILRPLLPFPNEKDDAHKHQHQGSGQTNQSEKNKQRDTRGGSSWTASSKESCKRKPDLCRRRRQREIKRVGLALILGRPNTPVSRRCCVSIQLGFSNQKSEKNHSYSVSTYKEDKFPFYFIFLCTHQDRKKKRARGI